MAVSNAEAAVFCLKVINISTQNKELVKTHKCGFYPQRKGLILSKYAK